MKTIYLADEDTTSLARTASFLEMYEFEVVQFTDTHEVQLAVAKQLPDLLIMEVEFKDQDGFSCLKKLRQNFSIPVFFVTSRISESDRILGFELGCDDYICKPYSTRELVLRIEAFFRRIDEAQNRSLASSRWTLNNSVLSLDETSHQFSIDSQVIPLTAQEWRIMSYLVANANILITRSQVLEFCFDYSLDTSDRIVDTHIKNIRGKMGVFGKQWIETVRGYGYRFMGKAVARGI